MSEHGATKRALVMLVGVALAPMMHGCSDHATRPAWGPVDGDAAMKHVEVMVGHGPRPSGSPALRQTQTYLKQKLAELGLTPQEQRWKEPAQPRITGEFVNIWAQIDGEDPKHGPILVLMAHYDTKLCEGHPDPAHNFRFVGAIDGAGGPATLLELARHLAKREKPKHAPNLWILFLDGEESVPWDWGEGEQALYGSKHFVAEMAKDKTLFPNGLSQRIGAVVLLDLIGSKNQKIDRDVASNGTLNEIFKAAAEKMGEARRMFESESTMTDDHIPFKAVGLRVIDLIDMNYRAPGHEKKEGYEQWWHTAKDDIPAMDPLSLCFVGNLVWNAIPLLEEKLFPGH